MKLFEILYLEESQAAVVVYKVTGSNTPYVYYGFTQAPNTENIDDVVLAAFMKQTTQRKGAGAKTDRGAVRWFKDNGGGKINAEPVEMETDPFEAWKLRNEYRRSDHLSITGPSILPGDYGRKLQKTDPEKYQEYVNEIHKRKEEIDNNMTPEEHAERAAARSAVGQRAAATRRSNAGKVKAASRARFPGLFGRTSMGPVVEPEDTM